MFLGYQTHPTTGKRFIALTAETRRELEEMTLIQFDEIVETDQEYKLFNGEYMTSDEYNAANTAAMRDAEIAKLRKNLADYDYIGVKIATGRATVTQYADKIQEMNEWAARISELEQQ